MTSGTRISRQLPAYLLGALDPGEQADLEHHLEGCAECKRNSPATGCLHPWRPTPNSRLPSSS